MENTPDDSGGILSRLRRALFLEESDPPLSRMLSGLRSLQACKDASLAGEPETRLLAVCRLAEFGPEAIGGLEIACHDDTGEVRAAALVFLTTIDPSGVSDTLALAQDDPLEMVVQAAEYAHEWAVLHSHTQGTPGSQRPQVVVSTAVSQPAAPMSLDPVPIRTRMDVSVSNELSVNDGTVTFRIRVSNDTQGPITDVDVRLLAYPADSLRPVDGTVRTVPRIGPGEARSVTFEMSATRECIEGEIVPLVVFTDVDGQRASAPAGNCTVRTFFERLEPLNISPSEEATLLRAMKGWSREHEVPVDPVTMFEAIRDMLDRCNLHTFDCKTRRESSVLMASLKAAGTGSYTGLKVVLHVLMVGDLVSKKCQLQIHTMSDAPEVLQTAASEFYQRISACVLMTA